MTSETITIIDPSGTFWEMDWHDAFDEEADEDVYCDFCERMIKSGWVHEYDNGGAFILCAACADGQDQA
jgi:hypothetical protein